MELFPGTQTLHALLYIQRTKPIEFSVTSRELVTNCLEDSLKVISPQFFMHNSSLKLCSRQLSSNGNHKLHCNNLIFFIVKVHI